MSYTNIIPIKCGCVVYIRDDGDNEVIVKVEVCEEHKECENDSRKKDDHVDSASLTKLVERIVGKLKTLSE